MIAWMDLVHVQKCESALPWWTVDLESESEPGVIHQVMVPLPTDGIDDFICDCKGYEYRGHCRHIQEAFDNLCRWDSKGGPEQQTPEQERDMICPRCGSTTTRTTEYA
jgi:hypothetical protein